MAPNERGGGNLKILTTLAIVALVIFVFVKLGPPFFNNYQLKEDLDGLARLTTYALNKSPEDIKKDVIAKAKDDDVLLNDEDVKVERTPTGVNIAVNYTVRVDILGQNKDLKFELSAGNKNITAK